MIRLNINEAKTHLSHYLKRVEAGETLIILVEVRPISLMQSSPRQIGLAQGMFTVPKEFFDPLPEDIIADFNGASS